MRGFGLSFDDFVEAVTRVGIGAAARKQLLRDHSDGGEGKLQILKPGLAPDRVPYSPIVSDPEPKRCGSSSACASALDCPRTFPAFVIVIHPTVVYRLYCLFDWLIRSFIHSFFLSFFIATRNCRGNINLCSACEHIDMVCALLVSRLAGANKIIQQHLLGTTRL